MRAKGLNDAREFELSRWGGRRYACDISDIVVSHISEFPFPLFLRSLIILFVAGRARFNSYSPTASAANASASLQTTLSKLLRGRSAGNLTNRVGISPCKDLTSLITD